VFRSRDHHAGPASGRRTAPRARAAHGGTLGSRASVLSLLLLAVLAGCSEDTSSPPVLDLDPTQITLTPGDSSGAFTVRNAGQGTIAWQLESDAPWLGCDPRQGSTASSQSVAFTVVAESLRLGPPLATVAVTSNGGSGRVRVQMWSALSVEPDSIDLGDTTRTAPILIDIDEAAPDTLWWTATARDAWLSVAPDAGFRADRPETLTVSADRGNLATGDHGGWVIVDAGALGRDSVHVGLAVPQKAGVLGEVYFASTQIPVAGVEVRIDAVFDTTDAQGRYILRDIPVGEHRLHAGREGFDDYDATVQVGESGLQTDFEMRSTTYTHTVSGVATNRIGHGVGSVVMGLLNPNGSVSQIFGLTANDGTYTLQGVPEGEQRLRWSSYLYETRISNVTVSGGVTHDVVLVAKPLEPPYLPVGPSLAQIECAGVRVGWTPRIEETVGGYRVERATWVGSTYEDVSGIIPASQSSFDDLTAAGDGFRYRLRTETIDGAISDPSPFSKLELADWLLLNDGENGPQERWGHAAIYDPQARRMVIFGGLSCVDSQCNVLFRDTWSLDLTNFVWEKLDEDTGPSKRQDHRAIYDPVRHRMVVFGGRHVPQYFNDTWAFDLASQTWSQLDDGSAGPPPRYGHAVAYDDATDRLIVYGGSNGAALNDVWAFHLATNTWERLRSGEYGEQDPQPEEGRIFPGAVADATHRRLIVYGGYTYTVTAPRDDAWALDLETATWTRLADGPCTCFGQAGMYDAANDRAIFYGGKSGDSGSKAMVALNLGHDPSWETIDDGSSGIGPGVRCYQTVIHDPARNSLVLFGGLQRSTLAKDAWTYCALE
jgi:hypothetical protein